MTLVFVRGNGKATMIVSALLVAIWTISTLSLLMEQLPWQNLIFAGVLLLVLTSSVQLGARVLGIEFYGLDNGALPLAMLPALFTARGAAQVLLKTKPRNFGLWLIGLTALIVALFGLGLALLFAVSQETWANHEELRRQWRSHILATMFFWGGAGLIMTIAITPWLLNKRPAVVSQRMEPLFICLLLNGLFATAAGLNRLWLTAAFFISCDLMLLLLGVVRRQGNAMT